MKNPFTLFALLSVIPGAYLSFKKSFYRDLKDQMVNLRNESGIGFDTVEWYYKILAYIFVGKRSEWTDLFDPTKSNWVTKDKTTSFRIFFWFLLTFIFSFLAWYNQ